MGIDARGFVSYLVSQGLLRKDAARDALSMHEGSGARIDTVLLDLGLIAEPTLLSALGRYTSARTVTHADLASAGPDLTRLISPRVAARFGVVPVRQEGGTLVVAALNPGDLFVEDELSVMTGLLVSSRIALEVRVAEALARLYKVPLRPQLTAVSRRLGSRSPAEAESSSRTAPVDASVAAAPEPPTPAPTTPSAPPAPATSRPERSDELVMSDEDLAQFPSLGTTPGAAPDLAGNEAGTDPADEHVARVTLRLPEGGDPEDRLAAASVALLAAEMRDDIADVLLGFCAPYLRRRMVLVVRQETVVGWRGEGDGVGDQAVREIAIPLAEPSVFVGLSQGQSFWLGSLPPMARNREIGVAMGSDPYGGCVILPVTVRSKVVCFLYGDNGDEPIGNPPMAELRRLVAKAGLAFQVYLLKSKIRTL